MGIALETGQQLGLAFHFHVDDVGQAHHATAGVIAALEYGVVFQVGGLDAQKGHDGIGQFCFAVIQRQFEFGNA
jgi:hypothetical protein